jgi:hypothetical protein
MRTQRVEKSFHPESCIYPVLILTFFSISYSKTAVPVFLLCGQSNMVSMASVNDLTADQKKSIENVMINVNGDCDAAKKGKWLSLGPGFGSQAANFGLELLLGKTLIDSMPGKKVAFIKYAINGSPLGQASGWLPPRSNNGTGGTHYKNMLAHVNTSLKTFNSAFDTSKYAPCWAGFIWLQGETDAMDKRQTDSYQTNLENLIKDIRDTLKTPDLPVILPLITTVSMWTYSSKIRDADVVMKGKYENVDTLETKNYQTPDGMHYNAAGQIKIGEIAAWRWLNMKYKYEKTVSINQYHVSRTRAGSPVKKTEYAYFDLSGRRLLPSVKTGKSTDSYPLMVFITGTQTLSLKSFVNKLQ